MIEKLGSDAAYSLIANANPAILITEAAMAGVALTVAAATFAYKAWEDYKESERKAKIETVLALHKNTLTKISIEAHNLTVDFPSPFQLVDGKYQSLQYTQGELDAMLDDARRSVGDLNLRLYRRHVNDALSLLVGINKDLKDDSKLVTPVIHYIIHAIESKFTKFEGYDWDIAMLNALLKFISEYMSIFDTQDDQTCLFTRLSPVYASLDLALEELTQNKKNRKQTTILAEASSIFEGYIELYIKAYLQLITPFTEWDKIKYTALRSLKTGTYQEASAEKIFLFFHHTVDASKIVDSIFRSWFLELITYYWAAIDNIITKEEKIPQLSVFNPPTKIDQAFKEKVLEIFKNSDNFLTTVRDPNPPHTKFVPITNFDYIMKYRVPVLSDLAKLVHLLCSFQLVLAQIDKVVQNLGEIEASDPNKCLAIYKLHTDLCKAIKNQVIVLKEKFNAIKNANAHSPQLAAKQSYFVKFYESFDSLQIEIKRHHDLIRERREKIQENEQEVKKEMQHATDKLIETLTHACALSTAPAMQQVSNQGLFKSSGAGTTVSLPTPAAATPKK